MGALFQLANLGAFLDVASRPPVVQRMEQLGWLDPGR